MKTDIEKNQSKLEIMLRGMSLSLEALDPNTFDNMATKYRRWGRCFGRYNEKIWIRLYTKSSYIKSFKNKIFRIKKEKERV